jgi:hypothetical protein
VAHCQLDGTSDQWQHQRQHEHHHEIGEPMTLSAEASKEAAKEPYRKPLVNAVHALMRELDLDAIGKARAELALNLARRLDASVDAKAGTVAQAASGLSKELERLLTAMVDPGRDAAAMEMIASIFRRDDS